jgi:hypothetical protein
MKDKADRQTADIFEAVKRRRGRPFTGQAVTNADRQRAYRQRIKKGQAVTKNQKTPGDFPEQNDILRKSLEQTVQHRNELLFDVRRFKDEIRQLKSVTVTENKGQGAVKFEHQYYEQLAQKNMDELERLRAENEKLGRLNSLLVTTSESYRKQIAALQDDHNKLIVKHDRLLKKRNVTNKQG